MKWIENINEILSTAINLLVFAIVLYAFIMLFFYPADAGIIVKTFIWGFSKPVQ